MTLPRLLGGRYELDAIVGRGGMGEVFRARDVRLERVVGVKTLRHDLARDETFQARFRREALSTASLNHPSIVAVYDTGEDMVDGIPLPYIVMEFVQGRTVRDLLRDGRRLPPERAAAITDGVLVALDYSHRNGIVHRDIKPGNVMVTGITDVKVMDFGLASAVHGAYPALTRSSQIMGTAQYLSPEQARGEQVDARSDLYSTGCVLYEMLTGRLPFTGDSPMAIAYKHVMEDPVPPSRAEREVPPWADAIVLKAMQKDPARRYQSATEMRADIQRVLAGAKVAAPNRKAWPWVTLAVAVVVLSLAFLGIRLLTGGEDGVGVPGVTGMSLVKAENAISGAGLRVGRVSYAPSGSEAKNHVISTSPSYGARVSKGSAVNLVVSKRFLPVPTQANDQRPGGASPTPAVTSSPATGPPAATKPGPPSAQPSPSPTSSCIVNLLGICV
jgi:serine/threonine-protein kinase